MSKTVSRRLNIHMTAVSSVTSEGISDLRELIYEVAHKIRIRIDGFGKGSLIGRMVSHFLVTSVTTNSDNLLIRVNDILNIRLVFSIQLNSVV